MLNEHDLHKPPNPISSNISPSASGVSSAYENLGLELSVCRSLCADSSVDEF